MFLLMGEWWAQVPVLALAAEYFFKMGVEGKRFRPMVPSATVLVFSCARSIFNIVCGQLLSILRITSKVQNGRSI
jgi:hypothetical protein